MNTNIENKKLIGLDKVMDVRPIPCSVKHGLIIRSWLELAVGDHFILLNDHDPVPLYYQFSALWPEAFKWEHLIKGPEEFRVKITKLKQTEQPRPPENDIKHDFGQRIPADGRIALTQIEGS